MKTKSITISSTEEKALLDSILDIDDWIAKAISGKIFSCTGRMKETWNPILFADESVDSIPANDADWMTMVTSRDDYKTAQEKFDADFAAAVEAESE